MHILSPMQKQVVPDLPKCMKMVVFYTGKKLSACFSVNNKTILEDEHDIVHYAKCPEESCFHDCVGEIGRASKRSQ